MTYGSILLVSTVPITAIAMIVQFFVFTKIRNQYGIDYVNRRIYPSTIKKLISDGTISINSQIHKLLRLGMILRMLTSIVLIAFVYGLLSIFHFVPK